MSDFRVLTCLACGKRKMYECTFVGSDSLVKKALARECTCGKIDYVVASFAYWANAKDFSERPLRKEFALIHHALQSKLKVIDLMKKMVDTLNTAVTKAELADDVKPLKDIAKWLKRMVMNDLHQFDPKEKQEKERQEFLASLDQKEKIDAQASSDVPVSEL
jgi:dimeric dUTPase (all-alpha-NTP-PPase superfamily)